MEDLARASRAQDSLTLGRMFASEAALEMNGERTSSGAARRAWLEHVWGPIPDLSQIRVDTVEGESSVHVKVVGRVWRRWPVNPANPKDETRDEVAPVEMFWVRQWDEFALARVVVGAFGDEQTTR